MQVGITSWRYKLNGDGCPTKRAYPQVFTRVSSFVPWIQEKVCEYTGELCVPTAAPSFESYAPSSEKATASPTISPEPSTAWPTWMPTEGKSGREFYMPNRIHN